MKFFGMIALMIALSAVTASASQVGPESSFEQIKAAGLIAGFPTIGFQTEGVTVDELCIDGNNLRPVQPNRTTCAEFDTRHDRFNCIRYVTTYLSTPIATTEAKCVKWNYKGDDCREYVNVPAVLATSYNISIYENRPKAGLVEIFTKPYEIPACQ